MPAERMGSRVLPEAPSVRSRRVLFVVFGYLAFVAIAMAVLFVYFRSIVPHRVEHARHAFPEPTLQISPHGDLDRFKREQRQELVGYAWVDRSRDLIRIPIEQAMRIVAGRGSHAYDAPDQPEVTPTPGSRGGARP